MGNKSPRFWDTPAMRQALADPQLRDPDLFAPDRHDSHPELDGLVRSMERQLWDTHMGAKQQAEFNYAVYGKYRPGYVNPESDVEVDDERQDKPDGPEGDPSDSSGDPVL